jgi:hypothetical protein
MRDLRRDVGGTGCYEVFMRALWLAIVACIVALGGAVGGVGAGELEGSLASGAPAVAQSSSARVRTQASYPELHAVTARASRARANDLPSAALSAISGLAAPQRRALVLFPLGEGRLAALPALTGSARGPPIA